MIFLRTLVPGLLPTSKTVPLPLECKCVKSPQIPSILISFMFPAARVMLAKLEQIGHLPRADVPQRNEIVGIQCQYIWNVF